jgi:hypothetical protein
MLLCVILFRIVSKKFNGPFSAVCFKYRNCPSFSSNLPFAYSNATLSHSLDVLDILRPYRKISDLFVNVN